MAVKQAISIVTGASSGIGLEFAEQLAAKGKDLLLIARRLDLLHAAQRRLSEAHGVQIEVVQADLTDREAVDAVVDHVAGREVVVETLVNNAGFGLRGAFVELDLDRQLGIVDLNVKALMQLSYRFVPLMQRGSAIINVASIAAFQPGPYMAVYYASKAFVLSFSEALYEELKGRGIAVQALCPGPTDSEFGEVAGADSLMAWRYGRMRVDSVVKASLGATDEAIVVPGVSNKLIGQAAKVTPRFLTRKIVGLFQK